MPECLIALDWKNIWAQGIGVLAALWGILSYQQKTQRGIVTFKLINQLLWMTHFLLLGAWAGCILNGIGVFRCTVFYFSCDHKWAQHKIWYAVFAALIIAAGIFSWRQGDGWIALLSMCGSLLSTYSLSLQDPFRVRAINLCSSPLWLIYNLFKHSGAGIVTELLSIGSIIIGILRHDLLNLKRNRSK